MSNVRKGKNVSNATVVAKPRALLVSRKTVDILGVDTEEKVDAEVLYPETEMPLYQRGPLEETRTVQPVQTSVDAIPPETPLVAGQSSNPINRVASRIVGFDVTRETPVQQPRVAEPEVIETPRIVPVQPELQRVSLGNEPAISYPGPAIESTPFATPQIVSSVAPQEAIPSYGFDTIPAAPQEEAPAYRINSANDPEGVIASIDRQVVGMPQEPRREVIEPLETIQPLQTPQEFSNSEERESSKAKTAEVIENFRNEFMRIIEINKAEQLKQIEEMERKLKEALNKGLDGISRSNDVSEEQRKVDMEAIKMTVDNPYDQPSYDSGVYGR